MTSVDITFHLLSVATPGEQHCKKMPSFLAQPTLCCYIYFT